MRFPIAVLAGLVVAVAVCLFVLSAIARRRHPLLRCPTCRSDRIRPSWPLSVDRLLRLFRLIPYRCESCRGRYYAFPVKEAHGEEWKFARKA